MIKNFRAALPIVLALAALSVSMIADRAFAAASVGSAAPSFTLPWINIPAGALGDYKKTPTASLANLSAGKKATVVMFVSVECPYSNAYDERMASLATTYGPKNVAFVGIYSDQGESAKDIASHADEHKFPFPALKDKGCVAADAYGATHTPEVYVIDAKGTVVYHGRIDDSTEVAGVHSHDLANALDEIVSGRPVATTETKAFGCSIKHS